MIDTQQAVMSLRPNIEWSMNGDDVEGITWHTPDAQPLTVAEVEAEMVRLEQVAVDADAAKAAARESAVAKLAALGLDSLEVQAIIGGI
tara:strand:- start:242 stop:508 length:267 start_codon:yes stop_codon:yes gene_type:complete